MECEEKVVSKVVECVGGRTGKGAAVSKGVRWREGKGAAVEGKYCRGDGGTGDGGTDDALSRGREGKTGARVAPPGQEGDGKSYERSDAGLAGPEGK